MYRLGFRPKDFTLNPMSPLAQGLVFAGLGRFTGSKFYYDSSIYRNHGTLSGYGTTKPNAAWNSPPGPGRNALAFASAESDYVAIGDAPLSNATCTISAWINPTSLAGYAALFSIYTSNSDSMEFFINTSTAGTLFFGNFSNSAISANVISVNNWFHVCGVSSGGVTTIYVNGIKSGTTGTTNFSTFTSAYIGARSGSGYYFPGAIADLLLFNGRAISPSAIAALANPANVMLEVGGVPLIQEVGRRWAYSYTAAASGRIFVPCPLTGLGSGGSLITNPLA